MNTDKLIAALTDAIDARKASFSNSPPQFSEGMNATDRYEACKEEVEHELKLFIAQAKGQ